jgi:hypothetical protein
MGSISRYGYVSIEIKGKETTVNARLYTGDTTTKKEINPDGKLVDVTRFRADAMVKELKGVKLLDLTRKEVDTAMNDKLKTELPTKTPIDEQGNDKLNPF